MKKLLLTIFLMTGLFSEPILKFYCGSTMAKAMRELSNKFEKQNNVRVVIIKGGGGKLYKKIIKEKDGDLYLPGAQVFITQDKNDLFDFKRLIGYNTPVILVAKGNPKGIRDLNDFTRTDVRLVLGKRNTGSVGKITEKILTRFKDENFYLKLYSKAIKAPTSVEIVQVIKNGKADVSINWKAAAFSGDNEQYVEHITIPYIAPKQKLFLTTIKYSKYPKLAKKFVIFIFRNKMYLKSKGF